jgi:hypothetical protein
MEPMDVIRLISKPNLEIIQSLQNDRILASNMVCQNHANGVAMNVKEHRERSDGYAWYVTITNIYSKTSLKYKSKSKKKFVLFCQEVPLV